MMILSKNNLEIIVMLAVMLAVMLPCSHATEQNVGNDYICARDQFDSDESYCDCFACNHLPCADKQQVQYISPIVPKIVNPAIIVLTGDSLYLPIQRQAIKHQNLIVSNALSSIHTVRLLI